MPLLSMSQARKAEQTYASSQRLVLCTCHDCQADPHPGKEGRMVPAHRRRTHTRRIDTSNPVLMALKNRGKRRNKQPLPRIHGRGGLNNALKASRAAVGSSQAGPSGSHGVINPQIQHHLDEPDATLAHGDDLAVDGMDLDGLGYGPDSAPGTEALVSEPHSPLEDDKSNGTLPMVPLFDSEAPDLNDDELWLHGNTHNTRPVSDHDTSQDQ